MDVLISVSCYGKNQSLSSFLYGNTLIVWGKPLSYWSLNKKISTSVFQETQGKIIFWHSCCDSPLDFGKDNFSLEITWTNPSETISFTISMSPGILMCSAWGIWRPFVLRNRVILLSHQPHFWRAGEGIMWIIQASMQGKEHVFQNRDSWAQIPSLLLVSRVAQSKHAQHSKWWFLQLCGAATWHRD